MLYSFKYSDVILIILKPLYGLNFKNLMLKFVNNMVLYRLLGHCWWNSTRYYISTISVYNQSRQWTQTVDRPNKRNPTEMIADGDYADDIALLENEPTQAVSLQHYQKQAVGGIGLHVKANKTE